MTNKTLHKLITFFVIIALIFTQTASVVVAQIPPEPPIPPEAPSVPTPPDPPTPPEVPTPPTQPTPPSAPTPPPSPSKPPTPTPPADTTPKPSVSPRPESSPSPGTDTNNENAGSTTQNTHDGNNSSTNSPNSSNKNTTPNNSFGETSGNQDASYQAGDPSIQTGSADSSAILVNQVNTNSSGNSGSGGAGDISVGNTDNGSGSTNSGTIDTNNASDTIQTNTANVNNDLGLSSVSGNNESSYNVGDAAIVTGSANTTASVINGVNTNIDGVAVIEFNVDDTHRGDIVLQFPEDTSGCTATVCGQNGNLTAKNSGNGSNSQNEAAINGDNLSNTFQQNSADVTNGLVLVADSGNNETSYNTGGDNTVTTSDANVVATVGNFVNNNIAGAGKVLIAVVNIFGDLIGNILLPESTVTQMGGTSVTNSDNGSDSINTGTVSASNTSNTTQVNLADIDNNINATANTGNNDLRNNTAGFENGGNVIETGTATVDVNAVNIANSNVLGDDTWWLVFVNDDSGNWVGRIMGAPDGATMAGSVGTEFIIGPDGTILAQNKGNGTNSQNTTTVNSSSTNTTTQSNQAHITNTISLVANTGNNEASYNTGGSNSIKTGNANVMANIVNFVNNNFVGGNVVVSIVNVFGSWLGSFVPPGEHAPQVAAVGGTQVSHNPGSGGGNGGNSSSSSDSRSGSQDSVSQTATVLGATQSDAENEIAFNFGGIHLGGGTGQKNSEVIPGQVIEDNTIQVPGEARTAGAKTVLPGVFWAIFIGMLVLVTAKKAAKKFHIKRKFRPAF